VRERAREVMKVQKKKKTESEGKDMDEEAVARKPVYSEIKVRRCFPPGMGRYDWAGFPDAN